MPVVLMDSFIPWFLWQMFVLDSLCYDLNPSVFGRREALQRFVGEQQPWSISST